MQNFVTNAINLKTYPLSETDKIILMYSQDKGLIKGIAKGAKKVQSKLGGRMDLLVANRLMLRRGKNLDTIAQAEALNTFYKIRTDMDKMVYSLYCAEIVMNFGVENDPSSFEVFNLLYKCLEKISMSKNKIEILTCVLRFQLKMSQLLGYGPELTECCICSEQNDEQDLFFSSEHGGVICQDCAKKISGAKKMNRKLQKFFITLVDTDFSEVTEYDAKLNETFVAFCFNIIKDYIGQFAGKQFKTLQTIGNICN